MTEAKTESESRAFALFPYLGKIFFGEKKETPAEKGVTFEERARVVASLLSVRRRGERENLYTWIADVKRRFASIPLLQIYVDSLPKTDEVQAKSDKKGASPLDPSERQLEAQTQELIETVLRSVEEYPVSVFGSEAKFLIARTVDENLHDSVQVKTMRIVTTILIFLIFGGVLYGEMRFAGVRQTAEDVERNMKSSLADVQRLKNSALTDWNQHLESEAKSKLKTFDDAVNNAKDSVSKKMTGELNDLPMFYDTQRENFAITAEAAANKSLDAEKTNVVSKISDFEAQVEGSVKQKQADLNDRLKDINRKFDEAKTLIAERSGDFLDNNKFSEVARRVDGLRDAATQAEGLRTELKRSIDIIEKPFSGSRLSFGQIAKISEWRDVFLSIAILTALFSLIFCTITYFFAYSTRLTAGFDGRRGSAAAGLILSGLAAGAGGIMLVNYVLTPPAIPAQNGTAFDQARALADEASAETKASENRIADLVTERLRKDLKGPSGQALNPERSGDRPAPPVYDEGGAVVSVIQRRQELEREAQKLGASLAAASSRLSEFQPILERLEAQAKEANDALAATNAAAATQAALTEAVGRAREQAAAATALAEQTRASAGLASLAWEGMLARVNEISIKTAQQESALGVAAERIDKLKSAADARQPKAAVPSPVPSPAEDARIALLIDQRVKTDLTDFGKLQETVQSLSTAERVLKSDEDRRDEQIKSLVKDTAEKLRPLKDLPTRMDALEKVSTSGPTSVDKILSQRLEPLERTVDQLKDLPQKMIALDEARAAAIPVVVTTLPDDQKRAIQKALGIANPDGDIGNYTRGLIQEFRKGYVTGGEIKLILAAPANPSGRPADRAQQPVVPAKAEGQAVRPARPAPQHSHRRRRSL